jgi:hypothetical protein
MAKKRKWITQREYKSNTSQCPVCEGGNITGGPIEINDGFANQDVVCDDCGAKWCDIYKLLKYVKIREPDGNKVIMKTNPSGSLIRGKNGRI